MNKKTAAAFSSSVLMLGVFAVTRADAQNVRLPSRFVPGDTAISAAANSQSVPSLAQGGSTVLAVWSDNRGNPIGGYEGETSKDILGLRLDGAGNLLEAVPFVVAAGPGTQDRPRAAWNGTNWLVVYETVDRNGTGYYTSSLEALRVSPSGQVLDPKPIKIYNVVPVGATWAVASDGSQWVVAIQSTSVNGDLVASRISAAGVLLDPGPKQLVPETYYLRGGFHLAYAGGVFLLAYEESMTGSDPTTAIRFDSNLNKLDPAPYSLNGSPFSRMISNGSNFYAVWSEQLPDFTTAIKGSRIGTNGQKLDGTGVNISGPNEPVAYTATSIAWDGTYWKVTWGSATGTRIARVSSAGQVLDPGGVVVAGAKTGISASAGNGTVQLSWEEYTTSTTDVFATNISASNSAGPTRTLSIGVPSQIKPDMAASGSGYMIVYRSATSARLRILAQPLDLNGNATTAEPFELDNVDASASLGYPNVAWNGSLYMVTWNNASGVVARRLQSNGTPIDAAPFVVLSSGFGGTDVEALGSDFLIVGLRCGINCQYIFPIASRVRGSDGLVLDASPIQFNGTYSSSPRLAVLGNKWLLVRQDNWSHDECGASTVSTFIDATGAKSLEQSVHGPYSSCGGNGAFSIGLASNNSVALMVQSQEITSGVETDVLARLINADGSVQPMINLTPWEGDQYNPRATWDGSRFVVVWQDQRLGLGGDWGLEQLDARSDLVGMRVTATGAIVDPQAFVFSNSLFGEVYPSVVSSGGQTLIAASIARTQSPLANYRIGYELFGTGGNQWPVAMATATPKGGDVPLSVTFNSTGSTDLDGTLTSYLWNFGDGATSVEVSPTHLYTVGGPFVATLTVTDNGGAQTMQAVLVNALTPNIPPVAKIASDKTSGPKPLDVTFYAAGSYDPDGFIGNIHWDMGDGSESWGGTAYHTYYESGTYHVVVTPYDGRGGTGTASLDITVGPPLAPVAPTDLSAIAFTPEWINMTWVDNSNNEDGYKVERCAGTMTFCNGAPSAWSQIAQTDRNINYYADEGLAPESTFSYRVRAFNVTAHSAYSNISTATTPSYPPVAVIVPSVLGGPAPLPVTFDGSGSSDPDGSIVSWSWDFGDGNTGSGQVVNHTFSTAGWVYVKLTVTDNTGLTAYQYQSINVTTDGVNAPATGDESTTYGSILSGTYWSTTTQDDINETLKEALVSSTSRLEHTWTLSVAAGRNQTFYLDAFRSTNSEGDNFVFEYSKNKTNWTSMVTVSKTADNDVLQSYAFTQDVTGLIYIRVRDLDRTTGKTKLDTVSVDHMYVASKTSTGHTGEVGRGLGLLPGGLLSVRKWSAGQLFLEWGASCMSTDTDYATYEGPLGNFTAHTPVSCSTGGATSTTITPALGNRYYLVVPNDGYYEGRYGSSSSGVEISAGPTRCLPVAQATGCP